MKKSDTQSQPTYPAADVVFFFSLLGGAIGGFILVVMLTLTVKPDDMSDILQVLLSAVFFSVFGVVVGFVPACLTGIFLAWKKFYIHTHSVKMQLKSYGLLFSIGFIITLLSVLLLVFINGNIIFRMMNMLPISIIGGLSAVVTGKLVLPVKD